MLWATATVEPRAHSYRSSAALSRVFECGLACLWTHLSNDTTFHSRYAAHFLHNETCVQTPSPYLLANKYPFVNRRGVGHCRPLRLIQEDRFVSREVEGSFGYHGILYGIHKQCFRCSSGGGDASEGDGEWKRRKRTKTDLQRGKKMTKEFPICTRSP